MPAIVQTNVAKPVLQLVDLVGGAGQRYTRAVNTRALFHNLLHFFAEHSNRLPTPGLLKELFFDAGLFVERLREQVTSRWFLLGSKSCSRAPGPGAEHE